MSTLRIQQSSASSDIVHPFHKFLEYLYLTKTFAIRLGAACPPNYNPADHFIQLLAGVPGREETTRTTIDTVCTAFARSEVGCKIAAEAENALYFEVCI